MRLMYKVVSSVVTIDLQKTIDKFAANGWRLHTAALQHEGMNYNDTPTAWVLIFESEDPNDPDDE